MGAQARYRRKFLANNPRCIFCGGGESSATIEHCPPRAMFKGRLWPEGFEFACCEKCNLGTSNDDLLIAMLGHINPYKSNLANDKSAQGIFKRVAQQFPGIWQEMEGSSNDSRRRNRAAGIAPMAGQFQRDSGVVNVPRAMKEAVPIFGGKLTKGIYHLISKKIFPSEGCILFHWFTNQHLLKSGHYPIFRMMEKKFDTPWQSLRRANAYLDDQFSYRATMDPSHEVLVLQCIFGTSFGFVTICSTKPGPLEAMTTEFSKTFAGRPLFGIVQSSISSISPAEDCCSVFSAMESEEEVEITT